jgi:hypothetical protein
MKRCDLTQVPCRKAIAEVIKENKNRYFLQRTYEVAKILLEGSRESTLQKMSEEDRDRFFLIWNILSLNNGEDIRRILNLSNYLIVRDSEKKAEAQEA